MEIKLFFRMLERSWWIIATTVLVAVSAALLLSYFQAPVYKVSSRFIVSPNLSFVTNQSGVLDSLNLLDRRSIITTYAEILKSPRIYGETINLLKLETSNLEGYSYDAVALPDASIIEFSVQGPDPLMAVVLANSIGQQAVNYVQNLYQTYNLTLLDPAVAPLVPISPLPLQNASIAFVIGLALGVGLALVSELLNTPIKNFMSQNQLDKQSLALSTIAFEARLRDRAFASTQDFSLSIVHLKGLSELYDVLPNSTLENIFRHVSRVLTDQLRGNDIVGRWGDIEFSILLLDTTGEAVLNTMGRVRIALSEPIRLDISGEDLYLSPEIGIAEYRVGDTDVSLVKNTRWALEIAKKNNNGLYLLKATEPL